MAEAVAEHSYGGTTIAHVVSHAGVSRKTFYELFRDKEACLFEAYDTVVEVLLTTLREAGRSQELPALEDCLVPAPLAPSGAPPSP